MHPRFCKRNSETTSRTPFPVIVTFTTKCSPFCSLFTKTRIVVFQTNTKQGSPFRICFGRKTGNMSSRPLIAGAAGAQPPCAPRRHGRAPPPPSPARPSAPPSAPPRAARSSPPGRTSPAPGSPLSRQCLVLSKKRATARQHQVLFPRTPG